MSIDLIVNGKGGWLGDETDILSYEVRETSTPIDPSDSSGATGTITFDVDQDTRDNKTLLLRGNNIELVDDLQGRVPGYVTGLSGNNGMVTVTADSRLGVLHSTVTAAPFVGNLAGAYAYYFSLAGITADFAVDAAVASRPVVLRGFRDDLWLRLKQLGTVEEVELTLVSGNIIVRPLRTREANLDTVEEESFDISDDTLAQYVEVWYYNNQSKANALVWPVTPTDDTSVITQGAGEDRTYQYAITSTPFMVNQPSPLLTVDKYYAGPLSAYAVLDKDENVVDPSWWTNSGGSITVEVSDDFDNISIRIITPASELGPFSIAGVEDVGDGSSKFNTLKITGSGVFSRPEMLTVATGADPLRAPQLVGTTIRNEAIDTIGDAYSAAMKAGGKYAGPSQTIDFRASLINREGAGSGQAQYPTFDDFNADNVGKTFNDFNTEWAGQTFNDFTAYYMAQVADTFENQVFGNVGGARILYGDAYYRARSVSIDPMGVNLSAEIDTIVSDFNTRWAGNSFNDFNAHWTGKTFDDFATIPLW